MARLLSRARAFAIRDPAPPAPPLVPDGADLSGGVIVLADVSTDVERGLVARWLDRVRVGLPDVPPIERYEADDPRLRERLARGDDPLIVPVRVAWVPRERGGSRPTHLLDLVTLNDPRNPYGYRQVDILRRMPDRCRLLAGAPATLGELRARWEDRSGASEDRIEFAAFVSRQARLALERAELAVRWTGFDGDRVLWV